MKKESAKYTIAIMLTMLILASSGLSIFCVQRASAHEEELIVPLAKVGVTVDGVFSAGEWDDAQVTLLQLPNKNWFGYLFYKHDDKYAYFFMDHVSDIDRHPSGWDNSWVGIDINSDAGAPKEDDLLFHHQGHCWIGGGPYKIEDPSKWAVLIGQTETLPDNQQYLLDLIENTFKYRANWGTTPAGDTMNEGKAHAVSEMGIPLSILENKTTCGVWVAMQDNAHGSEYPEGHILEFPEPDTAEAATDPAWWPGPDFPEYTNPDPANWGALRLDTVSLQQTPTLLEPIKYSESTPLTLEQMWIYIVAGVGAAVLVVIGATTLVMRRRRSKSK